MILTLGSIFNLYFIQIILSHKFLPILPTLNNLSTLGINTLMIRISLILIFLTLLFDFNLIYYFYIIPELNITFCDGLIHINLLKLILIAFILILSFFIILSQNFNIQIESYLTFFTILIGMNYLILSNDWIFTIINWELFNFSLYLLVNFNYNSSQSILSSSLKYFILSAFSTTFLFFGIFVIYYYTGSTYYDNILLLIQYQEQNELLLAYIFILICLLFKLSIAPLHNWAPDLYDALPLQLTFWMAIIPKLTVLFFLLNLWYSQLQYLNLDILLYTGIISIVIGALGLNSQYKLKRFLTYSGISHMGFIILTLYCSNISGYILYTIIYSISMLNVFMILLLFDRNINFVVQLTHFFKFNPFLSVSFILSILSLAGCPPLLGFFAKFYIIKEFINIYFILGLISIIISVISVYNYLSLIKFSLFSYNNISNIVKRPFHPIFYYIISFNTTFLLFGLTKPLILLNHFIEYLILL